MNNTSSPFDVDPEEARRQAEKDWDESTCHIFYGNVPPTQFRENVDPNTGLRVYKSKSQYEEENGKLAHTAIFHSEDEEEEEEEPENEFENSQVLVTIPPKTITTSAVPSTLGNTDLTASDDTSSNTELMPDYTIMKRWPQYPKLIRNNPALILKIFKAADDCGVSGEVKADNNDNVKGNKWAKLYDVCYGGSRGLLSPYLTKPTNASKFKTCISELWKCCRRVKDLEDDVLHDREMINMGCRQLQECNKSVEDKKVNSAKSKERTVLQQKEMMAYERKMGAIPPGAKGMKGAGRSDHSTNLRLGKPATCAFANRETIDLDGDDSVEEIARTPKRGRSKSPGTSTSRSTNTSSCNKKAATHMQGIDSTLSRLVDRLPETSASKSKVSAMTEDDVTKRNLLDLKAEYAKTIALFGPIAATSATAKKRYDTAIKNYGDVEDRLDALLRPKDMLKTRKLSGYDSDGSATTLGEN